MKVLIAVTHLLGTGHLSRALTLGRAFAAAGHQVRVASGGFPAPQLSLAGLDLVQLPPLRSDGVDFTRLLTADGAVADDAYHETRQTALCEALREMQPDVLITELFPFGRRSLKGEFLSLLKAAHALPNRPVVLASIRDILAPPSKPKKAVEADAVIAEFYDAVLVHSDPAATRLNISWPVSEMLAGKLRYTGYVAPPAALPHPEQAGAGEVLVSAGGGSVGDALYDTALEAAQQSPDITWRLLVGGSDAAERIARFTAKGSRAIIEAARPDFRQMLCHAAASVSMCGYNTALDLLQAGSPAVLVPFDAGKEVEQSLRAESLAPLSGIAVLKTADLTPSALVQAVKRVMAEAPRATDRFRFDGAARTVEIAAELAGDRR
ncbi:MULTISPECIES: glycosyltransferase family protein [Rhodobacterales]|jgi:predicted glycosyltransferase|uniref:glycosyltransferase family protein n=1 Tax=Rhodobacterales TaxID=204455 RepID=UPI00237FA6BE|nr:glycosyltransferase [Phaeobacter gallaeciensis]MDE4141132.1 glycosyltransferase [Phaeobacter gallaeciensis]MDE4149577.1 glycosyltransferase [Phaeobacter gallaeciensis]MDE4153973.1 glycosyltransferase [Phaeobacter gallaeciensis]MDE4229365.1 glycosyltransferase [Phaeobacter gallaeciensis]MDE4258267.1 glycosyltransferase [Phaeobacter gallaeciensis]